ncbi:unnamed protein product, partial [Polarella glacialis]
MAVRSFADVTVGFPSGGSRHAKDEWNASTTTWVVWSTGELRLDTASYALFFTPGGASRGALTAKPLGCLQKAMPLSSGAPGEGRSFVVSTNDPVHNLVRMGFRSLADEETFAALSQAAEAVGSSRFFGDAANRRSSVRASMTSIDSCAGAADELTMHIRQLRP